MKYNFSNTIGHDQAKDHIIRAIESNRLPHAYLIHGPQGSGLFAFAFDTASIILCESKEKPCLTCASCQKILNNAHENLRVYHPFPSMETLKKKEEEYWNFVQNNISSIIKNPHQKLSFEKEAFYSIDTMRQIQEDIRKKRDDDSTYIAIICDADLMGEEAANSFLKTLEEPKKGVLCILLTSQPNKLLPTIVSRCQKLRLGNISDGELFLYLNKTCTEYSKEKIDIAVKFSQGNLPQALDFLSGESDEIFEVALKWINTAENCGIKDTVDMVDLLVEKKDNGFIKKMLEIVLIMIRDACILNKEININPQRGEAYLKAVKNITSGLEHNAIQFVLLFTELRSLQKKGIT